MLRHILYDNQQPTVPVADEVEFMQNYIQLMRIRLPKSVEIDAQFAVQNPQQQVAPMLFISLVENAFKHGVSPTLPSFIHLRMTAEKDQIVFDITNSNYPKDQQDRSGHGVGLSQVQRRLDLTYPEQYVWEKLCLNCCVNAPGVITRLNLMTLANDRNGFVLFDKIVQEVAAVAQANGVDVDYEHLRSFVHLAAHKSPHYASMLQDAHNKRPLELSTISGAIVKEGKKFGIPTPVNETIVLLTSLIGDHYEDQWY